MADYVLAGDGCSCCYGPDGCEVYFRYVNIYNIETCGGGPGFTVKLTGPTACTNPTNLLVVPPTNITRSYSVPPDPESEIPPPCPGYNACCDAPVGIFGDTTIVGPTINPIGCCGCKLSFCITDTIPATVIYPSGCDDGGSPLQTISYGCGGWELQLMDQWGNIQRAWSMSFDGFNWVLESISGFWYDCVTDLEMAGICNSAP